MFKPHQSIKDELTIGLTNPFWLDLLDYMNSSIDNLTIENDDVLRFISLFESIEDKKDCIHWGINFSQCFYKLISLDRYQLTLVYEFIQYVQDTLDNDALALCQDELIGGSKDIKWLLAIDSFYQNLTNNFKPQLPLYRNEIIRPNFTNDFKSLDDYSIKLLSNKEWQDLTQAEMLAFLQGMDFHYLSDTAYFFVLPACMTLCIAFFKQQQLECSAEATEWMRPFLNDKSRAKQASDETKEVVRTFIKLLSHTDYYFLNLDDTDKLMKIWA